MSVNVFSCLILLLGLLFSSGLAKESEHDLSFNPSLMQKAKSNKESILLKPLVYEPERQSNRNLHTRNKLQPSRIVREMEVALDYACGYGGADCSAIQQGGSCYNPDTVHDHASYAFNDYYQRNPIPTSCDFGGTAVFTNVDPSTSTCRYPSTSTSSTVLNTTYPTGSTLFGSVQPATSGSTLMLNSISPPIIVTCLLMSLIF
ncbi:hypothetical protein OPV22_018354 [Ensete ventricosum]|uniref:X8 domain-containing protein n=1 Tax=Ensete ventricosum TaxID=4639 RepID=A0AAV8R017_ENSVE|nr:hypothetical protein OPV22_018354 [Ensete ventricosum]